VIVLLAVALVAVTWWQSFPLGLTPREMAFEKHLQDYDGTPVGAITTADEWDVVCHMSGPGDVGALAQTSEAIARFLGHAVPITFGPDVHDQYLGQRRDALVFLKGHRIVDVVRHDAGEGAALKVPNACFRGDLVFRWAGDEPEGGLTIVLAAPVGKLGRLSGGPGRGTPLACAPAQPRRDAMSGAKMFKGFDLDLTPGPGGGNVVALVNAGISDNLGGGIGTFESCNIPWTVTYDEILYGISGNLEIHVGGQVHDVGPGDVMWLPAGTELAYVAKERATFFFAVSPTSKSKSGSSTVVHPAAKTRPIA
jgi:ethanolamine utilization protein EutQ